MLLDILDKETKIGGNLGYKVFELLPDGRLAHLAHPKLTRVIGKEYRDNSTVIIKGEDCPSYKAGYHIFPSKVDAESYLNTLKKDAPQTPMVVCRVHFSRVHNLGAIQFEDKLHIVVVAGSMTIINIEKGSGYQPGGWGRLFRPIDKLMKK
jgi:hypothetical protein